MKKKEIKRPQHCGGTGLISKVEYLRLLHNVSKSELCDGVCSVTMYNRYIDAKADISLSRLQKLACYFGFEVQIVLQ